MAPAAVSRGMCEPLLGFMLLTLRAMTIATGMVDAVVAPTRVALREAVAVEAAPALLDGTDDLAVCGGERGRALQVFWRKRSEDIAEGGLLQESPFPSGCVVWWRRKRA